MNWVMRLVHRDRLERDLDRELRFHIDEETRRLVATGLSPESARRTAVAEFGGLEATKEAARDARGTRWLEDLVHDLRYAGRTMRRHATFTLAAVLSLAIGIGANTAIYGVLHALLVRPLAVASPRELSYVTRTGPGAEAQRFDARGRMPFAAVQRFADVLQPLGGRVAGMSSVTRMQVTGASGDPGAELVLGQLVTGNWFGVMGVAPQAGRLLTDADDATIGGPAVAVISDGYWTRRFARDSSAVGTSIRANGYPVTIVGIAAPRFDGFVVGAPVDVWVATALQKQVAYGTNADITDADVSKPWRTQEGIAWLTIIARVPEQTPRATAAAAVDVVFRRAVESQAAKIADPQLRAFALRAHATLDDGSRGMSSLREQFGGAVIVLMATVALVLLIACANLANLLMARGAARSREFAVRLSLGAARGRLLRQLLTESLALALLGGIASLFFAEAGSRALLRMASDGPTPLMLDVSMGWPIVSFAIGASIATGLLFGLLPAVRFSRADINDAVKTGGRIVSSGGGTSFGRMLVVAQVALSFVLLVGALLFVRTLHNLLTIDPGFEATHLVTARFDPRMAGYTGATMASLRERLLTGARAIPGADAAAVAMCGTMADCHSVSDIDIPGRPRGVGDDNDVQEDYVDAGYFPSLAVTFLAGRNFVASDTKDAPQVAVVNEAMARHFFGDVNPVGRYFTGGDPNTKIMIVGVVRDSRINGLRETAPRMAFYPYSQHPEVPIRNLYLRTRGDARQATEALRVAVHEADRGIAVREVVTLAELGERSIARERLVSTLTSTFGLLAVAVACLGLYAMVSYSVARRRNEIGIRLALGASPANVRWLVMRETLLLVALGLVAGVAATLPAVQLIASLLYGMTARDPFAWTAAVMVLSVVAMLAGAAPAWRASQVDPSIALRID
jgi:predicted permease